MPPLNSTEKTWRSLEEFSATQEFRSWLADEFPVGAAWLDESENRSSGIRRRRFIELMGASFAMAGLTSCGRQPRETILPYVKQPEFLVPGEPSCYASVVNFRGHARGIVVTSHLGRPVKIEGNPDHPASLGATDIRGQASVLDLYDPDRSKIVTLDGGESTWRDFSAGFLQRLQLHAASAGRGMAILIEPTSSPTLQRLLSGWLKRFPEMRVYQHSPLQPAAPAPAVDFSVPDLIVSVDDDFLTDHPESLRFTREFARRRRAGAKPNRLYVIEPTPTLTGAMADHRLASRPSRIPEILRAVQGEPVDSTGAESLWVKRLQVDLREFRGRTLVCGNAPVLDGFSLPGRMVPATLTDFPDLSALTTALDQGDVRTLLILGGNPVHTCPGNVLFAKAIAKAEFTAHLGSHEDETSALCRWHLPETHPLESWGDLCAYDGTPAIAQPLIEPLYQGRSAIDLLAADRTAWESVRETWRLRSGFSGGAFEEYWLKALRDGKIANSSFPPFPGIPLLEKPSAATPPETGSSIDLVIRPDFAIGGGEAANNGWLQEMPRPFTKLVWDNAALVSPAMAARHGLTNGDGVALRDGIEAPVWILPGQADHTVTVHLGYGRTAAGSLGSRVGFDAYPLVGKGGIISLKRTGRHQDLVTTQHHSLMEGRDLIWRLTADQISGGDFPGRPHDRHGDSLYPDPAKLADGRYAWAMGIDLSTCTGCSACVIACQAENNIPVVGKEEVARGREMHWIRLDRYFVGEDPNAPEIVHQPVTCQHCEQAPCEVVCPVEATVHTAGGLNAMVYNRCVGTRYCSNNCPYKVRRFNFFDYRPPGGKSDPRSLQANPEVTVRGRGVMEKCSYCVQRIQRAVIRADREGRRVREGEILTACQQACPAAAITFGDLLDSASRVSQVRAAETGYSLLGELNTRPRTTYLAKITNPHA